MADDRSNDPTVLVRHGDLVWWVTYLSDLKQQLRELGWRQAPMEEDGMYQLDETFWGEPEIDGEVKDEAHTELYDSLTIIRGDRDSNPITEADERGASFNYAPQSMANIWELNE